MATKTPTPTDTRDAGSPPGEASVSDLMQKLTEQTTSLARKEVELAKAEMALKGRRIGIGGGAFSGAGLLALFALGALTAAAILALATAVEAWLAAALVAVAYLIVAGALALVGRSKVKAATPPVPEAAMESVRQDIRETKEGVKKGRS